MLPTSSSMPPTVPLSRKKVSDLTLLFIVTKVKADEGNRSNSD